MRAGISFLILIVVSTGAFAEDKNNQANVYDEFRQWMKPLPDATVDEEVTARIKRARLVPQLRTRSRICGVRRPLCRLGELGWQTCFTRWTWLHSFDQSRT